MQEVQDSPDPVMEVEEQAQTTSGTFLQIWIGFLGKIKAQTNINYLERLAVQD